MEGRGVELATIWKPRLRRICLEVLSVPRVPSDRPRRYAGREHLDADRARRDLTREGYLGRRGWDVLRFPAREVYRPGWVAAQVGRKIAALGTAAPYQGPW